MGLPIAALLAGVLAEVVKKADINVKSLTGKKKEDLVNVIQEEIKSNPVLKNELNQEPLVQSRTFLASTTGLLAGLFLIRDQFILHGLELWSWSGDEASIAAYAIVIMSVYGILGRTVTGLRPAFSWIGDLFKKK